MLPASTSDRAVAVKRQNKGYEGSTFVVVADVGCGDHREPHQSRLFATDAVRFAHHIRELSAMAALCGPRTGLEEWAKCYPQFLTISEAANYIQE
jgi:hypothetical protein